jgi:hypothetical protein
LIDDAMKLGRATTGLLMGFSIYGRLLKAVRASRPNWPESFCADAAATLRGDGVKQSHQFVSKVDYLSYIDIQLTRYAAQHALVDAFPVADELGLKRWEQRWQVSRQRPATHPERSPGASFQRAA